MVVVGIRLASSARARSCDPGGVTLETGDGCVVQTEAGVEFGTVVTPPIDNPGFRNGSRLPRVLRRAAIEDEETFAHKVFIEKEAEDYCLERIRDRALAMKLGKVERQLDGKKMTFHFTAEGRIDFRDLVRDLSSRFHARIELRQIGEREDAGIRGGVGPCGRTLCCSTFLRKFDPVSIKMAKAQGLSLNPSKISGMCGRLMCCLKYEYDPGVRPERRPSAGEAAPGDTEPGEVRPDSDLPILS